MNDDNKTNLNYVHILILVVTSIISIMVIFFSFSLMNNYYEDAQYDYLKDGLDSLPNVSEDYRKGWMDCINELREFNTMVTNMTSLTACIGGGLSYE